MKNQLFILLGSVYLYGTTSCKLKESPLTPAESKYHFKATLQQKGSSASQKISITRYPYAYQDTIQHNPEHIFFSETPAFTASTFKRYTGVHFFKLFPETDSLSISDIASIYKLTSYNFIPFDTIKNGVQVSYYEEPLQRYWSTGFGDQTGSRLVITEVNPVQADTFNHQYEIRGIFNCTLYTNSGDTMDVKEGSFYSIAVRTYDPD